MTNYGAGNPVQYAFDGGVNASWYTYVAHDTGNTGLTTSLGASYTEGHSCAGALLLARELHHVRWDESGAIEYFFGASPNGAQLDRIQGAPRLDQGGKRRLSRS